MLRQNQTGEELDFVQTCQNWRRSVTELLQLAAGESSEGELAAFTSYALAFPEQFVALVDTYDTIRYARKSVSILRNNSFSYSG